MKMTDSVDKLAKLYVNEVIRLHGVPVSSISDRDPRFTSRLWPSLQQTMGTKLNLRTTFHPQTDGQSERTIQTLEDLLRSCVLEFGGNWEDLLPVVEFTYNNSHQTTIGMAPYEALCETLEIYNLNMQMCKPSCKRKTESGNISMRDGNQD
jgi:hypothetical protein